jgi:hypothetical protein
MENKGQFETRLISEEELEKQKEKRRSGSIDVFDVKRLGEAIDYRERIRKLSLEDSLASQNRYIQNKIEQTYYLFLKQENSIGGSIFYSVLYRSNHPFFLDIKKDIESGKDEDDPERIAEFIEKTRHYLIDRAIPEDAWVSILREYSNMLKDYDRQLKEISPKLKQQIIELFIKKINPELDEPKTEKDLIETLETINLEIRDPLKSSEIAGTHNSSDRTIDVDLSILFRNKLQNKPNFSKEAINTIAHEILHVISSGQVVEHSFTFKDQTGSIGYISTKDQWSGLQVSGFRVKRFDWLNEAMTEEMSADMTDAEDLSYVLERELLRLLLTKGKKQIDKKILKNAYFERRGYQKSGKDGQKFWNKFREAIRESYDHDPQFLIKIDDIVQKEGVFAAIKIMREWKS